MSLRDKVSPIMDRLAQNYGGKISQMTQKMDALNNNTGRLTEKFAKVGQSVDGMRNKLVKLGQNHSIKIDTRDIDRAEKKVGSLFSTFKSGFMGGILGGLTSGLAFEGLRGLGRGTLGAALNGSETSFRLNELMGGAAPVNRLTRQIDAYAPERRNQLLDASTKLSGAGISEDRLMPTLKMLNNISALTGQSVGEMALIQSKIKATGYVQGDEINQYKERGINLNPYIASQMGVNENQIAKLQSKGLITYDILDKAMQKYAGTGGKFGGAYERRRDSTPLGRIEHLSGKVNTRLREFGSDNLLPMLNKGLDFVDKLFEKIGPLERSFGTLKEGVMTFGRSMYDVLVNMGWFNSKASLAENLVNTMAFAVRTAGGIFQTVGGVISWFANNPLAQLTAGLFTVWRLIPFIDKAWIALNKSFLFTPLGAAIGTFVALGAAIYTAYEKFEWFRKIILDGWEGLKVFFSGIGGVLKYFMMGNWDMAASLSKAMDNEADRRGRMSILNDKRERSGHNERRRLRESNYQAGKDQETLNNEFNAFKNNEKPTGGLNEGISSSVGNSKSNSITINIKSLIEKSDVHVNYFDEAIDNIEGRLIEALLRVANSGTRVAAP